ncbi:MAG: 2-amino-4-hydroxy-6-hydroxymethyldihydropteridine diphosphokinase [Oscillospiraceae bacterium]|nr:2-amino-4-hydroxy-6-hydroxymethyldihydropteridine diphosphokinase [Oscillospiraceae bacterium]
MKIANVYLGLGSNVGEKLEHLRAAMGFLEEENDICVKKVSNVYLTKPVGFFEQDDFLNIAARITTTLTPQMLLNTLKKTERTLKREKTTRWGPRTIDIDILLYDLIEINTADLIIPHKEMLNRCFVLVPLIEICNENVLTKYNLRERLMKLPDREDVKLCCKF